MAKRELTSKDRRIADAFFAAYGLSPSDYTVGLAKSGNIKITSKSGEMGVFDPESGTLLHADGGLLGQHGSASKAVGKKFVKPPRPFSDEEKEDLASAARKLVASGRYSKTLKSSKVAFSSNGTSATVKFASYAKSHYEVPDVHLSAPGRKDKAGGDKLASILEKSIVLVPKPEACEKAAAAIKAYMAKRRKQHSKALETIPDRKPGSFTYAMTEKEKQAVHMLASSEKNSVNQGDLEYGDGLFTYIRGDMVVHYDLDGRKAFFSDAYENALQRYLLTYKHAKAIENVLIDVQSKTKDSLKLSKASYAPYENTLMVMVSGNYGKYEHVFDLSRGYKKASTEFVAKSRAAEDNAKRAEVESVVRHDATGSVLALAAAHVINVNADFITENRVVKILRGLKTTQYTDLKRSGYDGKFNLIPDDEIHDAVSSLLRASLVWEKYISGQYSDYYILKPHALLNAFIAAALDPKAQLQVLGDDARQRETVRYRVYQTKPSKKTLDEDLEYLIEHPAIWCWKEADVRSWLEQLPEQHKHYLQLRIKLEDDRHAKKYLKLLCDAALGNEPAPKKKGAPKKPAAPKPKKEPEYKAVESDRLSSKWDTRYVVVETATGEIVDTAQGYGYKSPTKAMAGWRYRKKRRGM